MLAGLRRGVTWELGCILAADSVATKRRYNAGDWVEFEWDENKRLSNVQKHGLDFIDAIDLFDRRHAEGLARQVGGEMRWFVTGIVDGVFTTVIYTRRNEKIRIISMRGARKNERARYQALYGH
jgi:uncharacterized DUF497 family protein